MLVLQLCPRPVIICVMCHQSMQLCRCSPCLSRATQMRDWWRWWGRRSGSSGHSEWENWEKVGSLGDNEDRLMMSRWTNWANRVLFTAFGTLINALAFATWSHTASVVFLSQPLPLNLCLRCLWPVGIQSVQLRAAADQWDWIPSGAFSGGRIRRRRAARWGLCRPGGGTILRPEAQALQSLRGHAGHLLLQGQRRPQTKGGSLYCVCCRAEWHAALLR